MTWNRPVNRGSVRDWYPSGLRESQIQCCNARYYVSKRNLLPQEPSEVACSWISSSKISKLPASLRAEKKNLWNAINLKRNFVWPCTRRRAKEDLRLQSSSLRESSSQHRSHRSCWTPGHRSCWNPISGLFLHFGFKANKTKISFRSCWTRITTLLYISKPLGNTQLYCNVIKTKTWMRETAALSSQWDDDVRWWPWGSQSVLQAKLT